MEEKSSTVQKTTDYLMDYIRSDKSRIGEKLFTEKRLCEELSVGRGTVREALRVLEAQGLIEIQHGKGAYIIRKDAEEQDELVNWFSRNKVKLKEFMEVRQAIEPLAIKLAVERGTDEEIHELEKIHHRYLDGVKRKDSVTMAECDEQFHSRIVKMARNKMLQFMNDRINEKISVFRLKTFRIEHNAYNAIKAHEDILHAIKERDAQIGEIFVLRHLELIDVYMENIML